MLVVGRVDEVEVGVGGAGCACALAARALSLRSSWGRKTETWRGVVAVGEGLGWVVENDRAFRRGCFGRRSWSWSWSWRRLLVLVFNMCKGEAHSAPGGVVITFVLLLRDLAGRSIRSSVLE